jgi:glycosyltransferase involved in cell wall biosynthesis
MTDEIADYCRAHGLRPRRLLTINDGIDTTEFAPGGGAAIRRELGIPADVPLVGIVGHIQEWKGQHLVAEAVAEARRRFPDLQCLVVGGVHRRGVEYRPSCRTGSPAPTSPATWSSPAPGTTSPPALDAMDVVIHASVVAEPFGRVMIEAMALGKPVIAPREGGPLVIVVDGETGLLVPPRDTSRARRSPRHSRRKPRAPRSDGPRRPQTRRRGLRHPATMSRRSKHSSTRSSRTAPRHRGASRRRRP